MAVVEAPGGGLYSTGGGGAGVGWSSPSSGITSGMALYGARFTDYEALYRTQPNLRLVVRFLGRNIGQLSLTGYRATTSPGLREPLDPGHPLAEWIRTPQPVAPVQHGMHHLMRGIVEDLALYDCAALLKVRARADGPLTAVRLPPRRVRPIGQNWLWPEGFRVETPTGPRDYAAGEMVWIHGHNPTDPLVGLSPVEALRQNLAEGEASAEWREQYWTGAARISGVIERPVGAPWSDAARNRFQSEFRAARTGSGPDAGGTPVLEDGMVWKEASFSPKDSEYLAARKLSREEVAAQYFIPPAFVGILENANFANIKEQHLGLYSDTLGPWLDWIEEELNAQLVPEFGDGSGIGVGFDIGDKLEGRFEERSAAMQAATGAPWLLRNEARARDGLPPVEGGNELVVPLNVLTGGQASPVDSAPPAPGELAGQATGAKARNGAPPRYLLGWEAKHREVVGGFLARQEAAVLSRLGAGAELADAFDAPRWNAELGNDLLGLAVEMAAALGGEVAERFGGEFDEARAFAWLEENARIAAEGINSATLAELAVAWSGVPRTGAAARAKETPEERRRRIGTPEADDDEDEAVTLDGPEFLGPARGVFAAAVAERLPTIARTRATGVGQWSRREGAEQAGAGVKIWVASGAPNSRHGDLDGEETPIGEPFSNGGQWPGDPALGIDETANCICSLDFAR